jgi:hypothetical protein
MKSDKSDMDVRGIQRVRAFLGGIIDGRPRSVNASQDRDPHRDQLRERRRFLKLSKEQEEDAFQTLLRSLSGTGLSAEKIESAEGLVFVVRNQKNQVVRELRGLNITDLYLQRFEGGDGSSGTLLRRSA